MSNNAFKDHLIEMTKFPLLNAEQELELGRRIKDEGDMEAREQLINSNLRLVVHVAKAYKNAYFGIDDLVAAGEIGLINAADKYDYTLGFRFSTLACYWIKQAIVKELTDQGRTIRLPSHIYKKLKQMREFCEEYASQHGEEPETEQIAAAMGIDKEEAWCLIQWKMDTMSMDTPLNDEEKNTVGDLVADDSESPEEYADRMLLKDKVQEILATLSERTQTIMKMRYGLGGDDDPEDWQNEHTLEEIGLFLGITRERVRQIEKETEQYLKIYWEKM